MRRFRWVLLGAALVLGGCNTVYSEKPLFGPEDAGARLKPGLWQLSQSLNGLVERDCPFDPNQPLRKWPSCGRWMLVRDAELLQLGNNEGKPVWLSEIYVLADGKPLILQTVSSDVGDAEGASADADTPLFHYAALISTARDAAGNVTAFRSWEAQCGPPDNTDYPEGSGPHPSTLAPLEGLAMSEDGQSCLAKDQNAIRRSVAASEAWDVRHDEARWIREPRADDFAVAKRATVK